MVWGGADRVLHAALSHQNDSSLYSQSSRKKVEHKGDTLSETCKGVIVGERPRETRISNEAKTRTILESLPDAFFRYVRLKEDVWSPYLLACNNSNFLFN